MWWSRDGRAEAAAGRIRICIRQDRLALSRRIGVTNTVESTGPGSLTCHLWASVAVMDDASMRISDDDREQAAYVPEGVNVDVGGISLFGHRRTCGALAIRTYSGGFIHVNHPSFLGEAARTESRVLYDRRPCSETASGGT